MFLKNKRTNVQDKVAQEEFERKGNEENFKTPLISVKPAADKSQTRD
jgi:hypothetical protein